MFKKDYFVYSHKVRHRILEIMLAYINNLMGEENRVTDAIAVESSIIVDWDKSIGVTQSMRAITYLVSSGYLIMEFKDKKQYVRLTPDALKAYQSEFFLEKYTELKRVRNNNRWMIATNIVVAIGVVYAIYKDEFKKSPSSKNKKAQTELSQTSAKTDSTIPSVRNLLKTLDSTN